MVATIGSERPGKYIGCVVDFDWIVIKKLHTSYLLKLLLSAKLMRLCPLVLGYR